MRLLKFNRGELEGLFNEFDSDADNGNLDNQSLINEQATFLFTSVESNKSASKISQIPVVSLCKYLINFIVALK